MPDTFYELVNTAARLNCSVDTAMKYYNKYRKLPKVEADIREFTGIKMKWCIPDETCGGANNE